ncbi:DUF769 domain-containing protein, partial [Xylella taiwanensis]
SASHVSLGGGYSRGPGGVGTDQQGRAATAEQVPGTQLPGYHGVSVAPPGVINARDASHSTTQSGISAGAITIRDQAGQQARTGQTAAETIAALNRDVLTGQDTSHTLQPIFNEQEIKAGFTIVSGLQREVGTFINNRAQEATQTQQALDSERAKPEHQRDPALIAALQQRLQDNATWAPGGTYRQITTALAAGISGNASAATREVANTMLVNYVQQQGASYIGHLVANGQLTEGTPLHAALHAIVACAGAAASQQGCGSGATGAAASSVLTGLFSATTPDETAQQREAKRNLILSLVTGIASAGDAHAASATHAATAALDNNWLATQQNAQMNQELAAANGLLESLQVAAKWGSIYARQEGLTGVGLVKGLAESGLSDIQGLVQFLSNPMAGLRGLKELITNPEVRQQLSDSVFQEIDHKIDRMQTALTVGGNQHAEQYGRDLGTLVWDIGSVVLGVGGVAKGGAALTNVGINLSKDVLEGMAASKAYQLGRAEAIAQDAQHLIQKPIGNVVAQQQKRFDEFNDFFGKRNSRDKLVIAGVEVKSTPRGSEGGSNKSGTTKVLDSQKLTDQQIKDYAQELAGNVPFKEVKPGVYRADLNDGTILHLRSVSSSQKETGARWTIDIKDNPSLREITNEKVELKFR